MVRQDSRVQHVRVGQNDMTALTDRTARVARRVAIVGEDAKAVVEPLREVVQFSELILRESLGGEEVKRARVGVLDDGVQHRQVVAERFARSSWRHHDEVLSGARKFRGNRLMRIELLDSFFAIGRGKFWPNPGWHRLKLRFPRGDVLNVRQDVVSSLTGSQRAERILYGVERRASA